MLEAEGVLLGADSVPTSFHRPLKLACYQIQYWAERTYLSDMLEPLLCSCDCNSVVKLFESSLRKPNPINLTFRV